MLYQSIKIKVGVRPDLEVFSGKLAASKRADLKQGPDVREHRGRPY
jgi:hypothetical protein